MSKIGIISLLIFLLAISLISPAMLLGYAIMEEYKIAGIIYLVICFILEWLVILFSPGFDEDTNKCLFEHIIDSYSNNRVQNISEENIEPFCRILNPTKLKGNEFSITIINQGEKNER